MGGQGVRFSAITHRGLVRSENEDSLLSLPEQGIWTVSDGMGGHEGGAFASQTVVEAVAMLPLGASGEPLVAEVEAAMARAHRAILDEAARRGASTIGATVVLLILTEGRFVSLWSGDSRLYRLRAGRLEMLSSDHSLVAEFVKAGRMTWDEAERQPHANAITRAVGVGDALELERVDGALLPGDRFLLCSDGLTKYADSATLERMLATQPIERVGEKLMDIALIGGGADNISLIVIDVPG